MNAGEKVGEACVIAAQLRTAAEEAEHQNMPAVAARMEQAADCIDSLVNAKSGTALQAKAIKEFEDTGLSIETARKLAIIYQDLLIADSLATVLTDALYQRHEHEAADYANLLRVLGSSLRTSWETLDALGVNRLEVMEALQ